LEDATTKLKRSEIRRQFVLGDFSMGRAPGSHLRSVVLAGIHVNVSINTPTAAMDDVFTSKCVILVKWFIRSKAIGINREQLFLWSATAAQTRRRRNDFIVSDTISSVSGWLRSSKPILSRFNSLDLPTHPYAV